MARPVVGLDVGTSAVRAAEVNARKDPPLLIRFAQVGLAGGAMVDGEIADPDLVVAAVRELWRRGGFKNRRVAMGVANQKVVVRQVDLPYLPEQELRGALQFQVQEFIPIPIDEAILDFQVLEEFLGEKGERMMRLLLVAAQREMIGAFVDVAQRAGLDPAVIDLSPFASLRALVGRVPGVLAGGEGEAIVNVGAGVTTIVVQENGNPRFVRILPMGGNEITEALVAGLGIPPADAEGVKGRVGVVPEGVTPPVEGAAEIIEQRAAAFIEEVRGSLDYYTAQASAVRVVRVVLTGGGSLLPNLASRIAGALHVPAEQASALARLKLGKLGLTPEQLAQISAVAAVPVGLAMGIA